MTNGLLRKTDTRITRPESANPLPIRWSLPNQSHPKPHRFRTYSISANIRNT